MRGNSTSECRKLAVTRSTGWSVLHVARSALTQSMRPATPRSAAACAPRVSAVGEMSTAVTCQPCSANHTASPPSPQPRSSASPGGSCPITAAVVAFTAPDQRL